MHQRITKLMRRYGYKAEHVYPTSKQPHGWFLHQHEADKLYFPSITSLLIWVGSRNGYELRGITVYQLLREMGV